jgi:ABC-type glycerol-3-phosphate transport system substrate-binding protein
MLVDITSGTAPDVFMLAYDWTGSFVKQKALLDLKATLDRLTLLKGVAGLSEYSPAAIKAMSFDGQLLGIPWESYAPVIIYNKTIFAKAGISNPAPDWTWDDLKAISRKLSIPNQQ